MESSRSTPDVFGGGKDDELRPLLINRSRTKAHAFSKAAIFVYISTMSSRYAFYGILSILPLFLRNILLYSETGATVIYQLLDGFCNFLPVFLAIFSDSIFGRYKSNLYFSVIFTFGTIVLTVGALPFTSIPVEKLLMILALLMLAVGQGGLQTSQAPLGGDQFVLPQEQEEMDTFFATYYFLYNGAGALAKCITPFLRQNVHCFGQDTCYSLGFGVPVLTMILGTVVFAIGRRHYKMKTVCPSIVSKTFKTVAYALGNTEVTKSEHWLDKASEKFGCAFVNDLKSLIRLMFLFTPIIIFWSLYSQQGSTWTFQATGMSGYVTPNFSIQPDQVQMTNSVLLLILIPIFEMLIYPCFKKIGLLTRPLQKMGMGCILIALSFAVAGTLELMLRKTYPVLPGTDETSFNFINPLPCSVNVTLNPIFLENSEVSNRSVESYHSAILPYKNFVFQNIPAVDYNISVTLNPCDNDGGNFTEFKSLEYLSSPGTVHTFVINESTVNSTATGTIISSVTNEDLTKSNEGNAKLRMMGVNLPANLTYLAVTLVSNSERRTFSLSSQDSETLSTEVDPERYLVTVSFQETNRSNETFAQSLGLLELDQGGSYLLLIYGNKNQTFTSWDYVLTQPNSIHMAWQLPQYVLLTIADIFVSLTGFQFAYAQAPNSMKALVCSLWLWQNGMGDLVVVLVVSLNVFPNQAITFFFFSVLMMFGTVWFGISARRYEEQIQAEHSYESSSSSRVIRLGLSKSCYQSVTVIPRSNSLP